MLLMKKNKTVKYILNGLDAEVQGQLQECSKPVNTQVQKPPQSIHFICVIIKNVVAKSLKILRCE